jgi:precorrin-6A/cobalt-precorrin-6A reductase
MLWGLRPDLAGFGGVDGLADWVRQHNVDMMLDMTHPYAAQMSRHVAAVADALSLPTIAFHRPPWIAEADDQWAVFDSWQAMAKAVPAAAKLFIAGGSRDLEAFCQRSDISLLIRGLNLDQYKLKYSNINIIKSLPNKSVELEAGLLRDHGITHICCKNSGGAFSQGEITGGATVAGCRCGCWRVQPHRKRRRFIRSCMMLIPSSKPLPGDQSPL